ncbi:hypothetical protein KIPB_002116 [Kipferlia bialata]|uniref:Calcineurin-like phosphoesterase domain-containing protein n=1 Tax=Kipferlia bialata TaxID=797122 RepID=A0A9K3CPX3_9EUKA|nr:hypothetical protein KIPB_002116 [Kipferlia bialata]|eukprot:g2116.t1
MQPHTVFVFDGWLLWTALLVIGWFGCALVWSLRDDKVDVSPKDGEVTLDFSDDLSQTLWFVQVSDVHAAARYGSALPSFQPFVSLVKDALPILSPDFVVVTGDLCDGWTEQVPPDWALYHATLEEGALLDTSYWVDIKGNHDAYGVVSDRDYNNTYCIASVSCHRDGHCSDPNFDGRKMSLSEDTGSLSLSSVLVPFGTDDYTRLRAGQEGQDTPPVHHRWYRALAGQPKHTDTLTRDTSSLVHMPHSDMAITLVGMDVAVAPGLSTYSSFGHMTDDQLSLLGAVAQESTAMHTEYRQTSAASGPDTGTGTGTDTDTDGVTSVPVTSHATVSMSHYPLGAMAEGRDMCTLLGPDHMLHLSGHVHSASMAARRGSCGAVELEAPSLRYQNMYRVVGIDHGFLSAVDVPMLRKDLPWWDMPRYNQTEAWPVVLPTVPPHASLLHPAQPLAQLKDAPIRVVVMSPTVPYEVHAQIDGGETLLLQYRDSRASRQTEGPGVCDPDTQPRVTPGPPSAHLYTLPYDTDMYSTGLHSMVVSAYLRVDGPDADTDSASDVLGGGMPYTVPYTVVETQHEEEGEGEEDLVISQYIVKREVEYPFSLDGTAPQPHRWRRDTDSPRAYVDPYTYTWQDERDDDYEGPVTHTSLTTLGEYAVDASLPYAMLASFDPVPAALASLVALVWALWVPEALIVCARYLGMGRGHSRDDEAQLDKGGVSVSDANRPMDTVGLAEADPCAVSAVSLTDTLATKPLPYLLPLPPSPAMRAATLPLPVLVPDRVIDTLSGASVLQGLAARSMGLGRAAAAQSAAYHIKRYAAEVSALRGLSLRMGREGGRERVPWEGHWILVTWLRVYYAGVWSPNLTVTLYTGILWAVSYGCFVSLLLMLTPSRVCTPAWLDNGEVMEREHLTGRIRRLRTAFGCLSSRVFRGSEIKAHPETFALTLAGHGMAIVYVLVFLPVYSYMVWFLGRHISRTALMCSPVGLPLMCFMAYHVMQHCRMAIHSHTAIPVSASHSVRSAEGEGTSLLEVPHGQTQTVPHGQTDG